MILRTAFLVGALVIGSPAMSQSSLGITGATLEVTSTEDEAGQLRTSFATSVDVRITECHGLQGDLRFGETRGGTIGHLGGHLYLAPQPGQKYGLFLSLSDVDGRSMAWVNAGAEAMFSLGENTTIEGRLGLGRADSGSLDYIFGGVSLAHALSPSFEVEAALDVADFDEAAFRATSVDASLTARYSPQGSPWGVYASVTQSELVGRDGGISDTRFGLGMTFNFGQTGGVRPTTRMFRSQDPVSGLVRRGIW